MDEFVDNLSESICEVSKCEDGTDFSSRLFNEQNKLEILYRDKVNSLRDRTLKEIYSDFIILSVNPNFEGAMKKVDNLMSRIVPYESNF